MSDFSPVSSSQSPQVKNVKRTNVSNLAAKKTAGAGDSKEDSYHTNYSNEVLKPVPKKPEKQIRFPVLIGTTNERIERSIKEASNDTAKQLGRLKEKLSEENYGKALKFIQGSINGFRGNKVSFIDGSLGDKDPVFVLTVRLNQNKESIFNKSTGTNLKKYSDFIDFQRSKGVVFSLDNGNALYQSKKGLSVLGDHIDGLKKLGLNVTHNHMKALTSVEYDLRKDVKEKFDGFSDDQVEEATVNLLKYMQPKVLKEIEFLEKVKPGLGESVRELVTSYIEKNGAKGAVSLDKLFSRVNRYVDGLALQGETDIGDAIYSLSNVLDDVDITDKSIEKLLKLHFHGGIAKPSRLLYFKEKEPQKTFDGVLDNLVSSFEGNIKPDDKVAVVVMSGVPDHGHTQFDVFGVRFGNTFKELNNSGHKILAYEVDQDNQILTSVIRAKNIAKKAPDIFTIAGHGSVGESGEEDARATILGKTEKERLFEPVNPDFIKDAKERNPDLHARLKTKLPLPKWNVKGVGNSEVTFDAASFDKGDVDIMQNLGLLLDKSTQIVLFACAVGSRRDRSLAQVIADEIGCDTYACKEVLQDAYMKFDSKGKLNDVKFETWGREVPGKKFTPKE